MFEGVSAEDELVNVPTNEPALSRRARIAVCLRGLLGELDAEMLGDIEQRVKWIHAASGEQLFAKGDAPDGAYVVALGRLRVLVDGPEGERIIDEVGPGSSVGEMALLTRKERSATVVAARDSELLWLSSEAFDYLVARFPRLLLETSRVLVERLQRQMHGAAYAIQGGRTFAIVPCGRSVDASWFADQLAKSLARHGRVERISVERIEHALGARDVARASRGDEAHRRLSSWLMAQERAHDFVLYEADDRWSEWTDRSIRHADHVLLVADGASSPELAEVEVALAAREDRARRTRTSLVLLQRDGEHAYPGTARWLERRSLHGHHHVRRGRIADVERISRILTGNAIGVVFGGGGSRGYAHIGVLRALEELGIPVDVAGGASIGAVIAMAKGLELRAAEILRVVPPLMRSAFFDPTLPLASLMRGEHTLEGVRKTVGDIAIEDFVLPIFAVSTNLTRGEQVVHRTGPAAIAIRASGSVPGIFPPVPWNGDLLVDGGLSNNVPVDVMGSLFTEKVVAVDVIPDVDLRASGELPASLSGFRVAWQRLNPFAAPFSMPSILSTLMRSATTSSRGLRRVDPITHPHVLYLKPQLRRWNLIDFSAAEAVESEGYERTFEAIEEWWSRERPGPVRTATRDKEIANGSA